MKITLQPAACPAIADVWGQYHHLFLTCWSQVAKIVFQKEQKHLLREPNCLNFPFLRHIVWDAKEWTCRLICGAQLLIFCSRCNDLNFWRGSWIECIPYPIYCWNLSRALHFEYVASYRCYRSLSIFTFPPSKDFSLWTVCLLYCTANIVHWQQLQSFSSWQYWLTC